MDRHELAQLHELETLAVRHGLPALDTRMTNEFGIEWIVSGYVDAPGMEAIARGIRHDDPLNPLDLMPLIAPLNLSQRLADFLADTDFCTSKFMLFLDTLPAIRTWAAYAYGQSVDFQSGPDSIRFMFDAAHLHETIFAHEVAHVWVDVVEGCQNLRILADQSDTASGIPPIKRTPAKRILF